MAEIEPASDELVAEIERGLEGVTAGPWQVQDGCSWRRIGSLGLDGNVLCPTVSRTDGHPDLTAGRGEHVYKNLHHIARMSPDNIAAILARLRKTEAERDEALRKIENADFEREIIAGVRDEAKRVLGGNCAFVDDDLRLLATLAERAIESGLLDGLNHTVIDNMRRARATQGGGNG